MTYSDALWGNASCDVGVKSPSVTGSHLWRMKYLRYSKKKSFVKFQTSNVYLKKKRSADKKLKNNKKQTSPNLSTSNGINVEIRQGQFVLTLVNERQNNVTSRYFVVHSPTSADSGQLPAPVRTLPFTSIQRMNHVRQRIRNLSGAYNVRLVCFVSHSNDMTS